MSSTSTDNYLPYTTFSLGSKLHSANTPQNLVHSMYMTMVVHSPNITGTTAKVCEQVAQGCYTVVSQLY